MFHVLTRIDVELNYEGEVVLMKTNYNLVLYAETLCVICQHQGKQKHRRSKKKYLNLVKLFFWEIFFGGVLAKYKLSSSTFPKVYLLL